MHAGFALEIAVCVIAFDVEGGAGDAGFLVADFADQLDVIAMPFRPAGVHAHEHLGPIARLGAAGAGLICRKALLASCEPVKAAEVEIVELFLDGVELFLHSPSRLSSFGCSSHRALRSPALATGVERVNQPVERLELLDDLLGLLLVVPEVGLPHLLGEFIAKFAFVVQVKESPGAGSSGA